jgi:F-type H+-transporting ATPase subunit b
LTFIAPLLQAAATQLAAAPQAPDAQLLDIDGSVFIMLGIFLVLMLVLWVFLWKPYLRARDERVCRIDGARDQATKLDTDAAARLARIETALTEARRGGDADMAKLRIDAQASEQAIVSEAQNAGRAMLADARAKLDVMLAKERANLQAQTSLLGRQIAEKTLGRRLSS